MFQTLSFCFRIGGPPPLIEEILWFGDIGLANLITQSRCEHIHFFKDRQVLLYSLWYLRTYLQVTFGLTF